MAGPGVALRLHEFRESQDSGGAEGAETLRRRTSRPGRDTHGLYPGQLGRVHTVHSKDCGGKSRSLHHESLNQQQHENSNYPLSFDVQTLRALTVLHHHSPHVLGRRRPQTTTYQDEFGLLAPLCPQ